jgi:phospholipid/cholesterol/gamma-HCH transport system substrate-binding protein
MRLSKRIRIQLPIFAVVAIVTGAIVMFGYVRVQSNLLGLGRYSVTVKLPTAGTLYETGNVTYRGVQVGRVQHVQLTDTGAEAVLRLNSSTKIPADVTAEVHSVSPVGEQYVALIPRSDSGATLKNGDVIPEDHTYVPPDINSLLAATNRGLNAIPRDNLKTVIDESYTAFGGLGPELSRLVQGASNLAIDAHNNLDAVVSLIDRSKPVLDSQTDTSSSIQAWAAHLARITKQLKNNDAAVQGLIQNSGPAADEVRNLFDQLQPTLPIVLANLVSTEQVAVTYRDNLEAILVLLPEGISDIQGSLIANRNTKQAYGGANLSFNLNLNLPPPCTTGYLPPQQIRSPVFEDAPPRPPGNFYCRVPQDSQLDVRGARNYPCETRPGKRAATVKLCESDESYIPLNEGWNWKGDANATTTGQGVPQYDPGTGPPAAPPPGSGSATATAPIGGGPAPPAASPFVATAQYDPTTGKYVGPDGRIYTQSDLAVGADKEKTWQQMLVPPAGN